MSPMKRTLIGLSALWLTAPSARAAGFDSKTMVDSLPGREIERPLVIGKGWLELGLGADFKEATGQWGPEGEKIDWRDGATFTYNTQRVDLRYGISRRFELYGRFKTHYVRLTNEQLDTETDQFGMGDPNFGLKYEAFRSAGPLTSVILFTNYKGPAANESPGNYVGGPSTFSSFVLTTGTADWEMGARGKHQVGPLALSLGAAYVYRFSDVTQYAIETELNQFNMRVKPGNLTKVDADLMLQLGPIAVNGGALFTVRDVTRIGASSAGFFPAKNLRTEQGSDGVAVDAMAGLTLHASRRLDLIAGALLPVQGEDLMYFPIEDLHPTRGNTYSGTIEFRY
jgi:hypothetical protein